MAEYHGATLKVPSFVGAAAPRRARYQSRAAEIRPRSSCAALACRRTWNPLSGASVVEAPRTTGVSAARGYAGALTDFAGEAPSPLPVIVALRALLPSRVLLNVTRA